MKPVGEQLASMLNAQIAHEIGNELLYRQIASYAHTMGLSGVSKYFSGQADDEAEHARWIIEFLNKANAQVAIPAVAARQSAFASCEEVAALYVETEAATTDALEAIARQADAEYDIGVQDLMQKMLAEQTEEEGAADRFARLVQVCGGDLIKLDLMLR